MDKLKLNEYFYSLQGEGAYVGCPALFIRTAGCNKKCAFCDTDHSCRMELTVNEIVDRIKKYSTDITVVWTGGEPSLQSDGIKQVIKATENYCHHLETNGSGDKDFYECFDYVAVSPKDLNYVRPCNEFDYDIKVVTDGEKLNADLIDNATMLMPLTTKNLTENKNIQNKVAQLCLVTKKRYSPRLHLDLGVR